MSQSPLCFAERCHPAGIEGRGEKGEDGGKMAKRPVKTIDEVFSEDGRYCLEAVKFVREGYSYTVSKLQPEKTGRRGERHVSGAQLCEGLRDLAAKRWGLLARSVMQHWNITKTRDFGEIVFMMVNSGFMKKQPQDRIEDFDDIYDFKHAFDLDFQILSDE